MKNILKIYDTDFITIYFFCTLLQLNVDIITMGFLPKYIDYMYKIWKFNWLAGQGKLKSGLLCYFNVYLSEIKVTKGENGGFFVLFCTSKNVLNFIAF